MAELATERVLLEPAGPDFPYYRGDPVAISATGWILVLAAVAIGFAALTVPMPFTDTMATGWVRAALFVALPLAALAFAAGEHWRAIFGPVGWREIKLMFVFAVINILVSFAVGAVVKMFGTTASNAAIAAAGDLESAAVIAYFGKVGVQLLGEELVTILPFLALMTLFHQLLGQGRRVALIAAWLISAIIFGLLHLPTYDWNILQSVVIIGSARLVLTWAYIWTKNIWVSTGAHIINDWTLIGVMVFLAPMATAG